MYDEFLKQTRGRASALTGRFQPYTADKQIPGPAYIEKTNIPFRLWIRRAAGGTKSYQKHTGAVNSWVNDAPVTQPPC